MAWNGLTDAQLQAKILDAVPTTYPDIAVAWTFYSDKPGNLQYYYVLRDAIRYEMGQERKKINLTLRGGARWESKARFDNLKDMLKDTQDEIKRLGGGIESGSVSPTSSLPDSYGDALKPDEFAV